MAFPTSSACCYPLSLCVEHTTICICICIYIYTRTYSHLHVHVCAVYRHVCICVRTARLYPVQDLTNDQTNVSARIPLNPRCTLDPRVLTQAMARLLGVAGAAARAPRWSCPRGRSSVPIFSRHGCHTTAMPTRLVYMLSSGL